jgi:copper chaperone
MKTTLNVNGMSCMNCVRHVREALEAAGATAVAVELEPGTASFENLDAAKATEIIEEEGYQVAQS